MKLTVLVDDNDKKIAGIFCEHGLSFFIEHKDVRILFDTGFSDIFLKNAEKLGIDLFNVDYLVLSHGHNDHTGGLPAYSQKCMNKKIPLVAHIDAFKEKMVDGKGLIGCPVSESELSNIFDLKLTKEPLWISDEIVFLGEIPRKCTFEPKLSRGYILETKEEDFLYDDSALVVNTDKGIIIITGCSHSGIANICEYAKTICQNDKIYSIIGGLHLLNANDERINKTVEYLKSLNLDSLYACHCTGDSALNLMNREFNLKEVFSGLQILF